MFRYIPLLGILALASCGGSMSTQPYTGPRPAMIGGTHVEGTNITEPRPRESRYLTTTRGGFVILDQGAAYFLGVTVKPLPKTLYAKIEYENPRDRNRPFVNSMVLKPGMKNVRFSSPDVVNGIRNYADYTVQVRLYESASSVTPVDTLTQPVRSYVDTTAGGVQIFSKLNPR